MPFAGMPELLAACKTPIDQLLMARSTGGFTATGTILNAHFMSGNANQGIPFPFGTITTAFAPDSTTPGALRRRTAPSGDQYVTRFHAIDNEHNNTSLQGVARVYRPYMLVDVLSLQGGLPTNVTTTQTTNLPTAALTRYTDGVGVMAFIRVTDLWTSPDTTISVSYTNSDGVAGRTAYAHIVDTPAAGLAPLMMFDSNDRGVRSVESITLSVATGNSGNAMGVMLVKPLAIFTAVPGEELTVKDIVGWNNPISSDACLAVFSTGGATGDNLQATMDLIVA
jgi:hypothetical protein